MPGALSQIPPFLHPAMVGPALLVGLIPVLVHLINRRRYVRVQWAAMRFLLAANRRSLKRIRIEQLLLLLARIGVVVLFGLALARPYLSASSVVPMSSTRVHRVILLDNSLSMSARTDEGASRFERAKQYAGRLVDAFPPADPVSIVTCSDPAGAAIGEPAFNRRLVRQQLAAIRQTQRGTDVVGALSIAGRILSDSESPPANKAVYLISDFPVRLWHSEAAGNPTPTVGAVRRLADALSESADGVTLMPVAADEIENIAVTRMRTATGLVAVNRPVRITVEVTNLGRSARRDVVLQVVRGRNVIRRESLPTLEPGESTVSTIATVFTTPGTHLLEASIAGGGRDALPLDDSRFLSIEVREKIAVLLVDGRPGITRLSGQAGYLATALAPEVGSTDATVVEPVVITEPELAAQDLFDYDALALCNVAQLAEESWDRVSAFVDSGGGLLVFAGNLVDVEHYNQFAYAAGKGWLPGRLSRARTTENAQGATLGFAYADLVHPCVREFADHADSGLFSARVNGYLPIELDQNRSDVVMRFTNGAPAIVASRFGAGRVICVTTTANMDWTNLPAKGDYVSLMSNILAHLVPARGEARNVLVGQFGRERLTAVETSMSLTVGTVDSTSPVNVVQTRSSLEHTASAHQAAAPSGRGDAMGKTLVPDGNTLAFVFGPIESVGPVRVTIGSDVRLFAANMDRSESDLSAATTEMLERELGPEIRVVSASESLADSPPILSAGSAEIAPTLFCAVIALLLVEMWMAMQFGSQRVRVGSSIERESPSS